MSVSTDPAAITFPVHDVEPGTPVLEFCTPKEYLEQLLATGFQPGCQTRMYSVEASSHSEEQLLRLPFANALVGAVHVAFSQHLPLTLSPDLIWLAIAQGFAQHIQNCHETLRSSLVQHEGRATIIIERDDFIPGSPSNAWPEVFDHFSASVRDCVGPLADEMLADFSTTGPVERAASQVVLLGAFEPYLQYIFRCICGIPTITLEGTVADWHRLQAKVENLRPFQCDWWIDELLPICAQFVRAAQGDVDRAFWKTIYKVEEVYGGENVEGWIGKLFPYIKDRETGRWEQRNPLFEDKALFVTTGDLPKGLTHVPFTFECNGLSETKHFLAGFTGSIWDQNSGTIRPRIGWAVAGDPPIERLLHRLESEGHRLSPPRDDLDKVVVDPRTGWTHRNPIGEQDPCVWRFYETCDGADLFNGAYVILPLGEMCGRNGPGWRWQNLGYLKDGSRLIIGQGILRFSPEDGPESGVLVARSLPEFLARALDSNGELYMDAPDFVPYPRPHTDEREFEDWLTRDGTRIRYSEWKWEDNAEEDNEE